MNLINPENYASVRIRLWCSAHSSVHEFDVGAVERIVYALSARIPDAYGLGSEDTEAAELLAADGPPCPLDVLRKTDPDEVYAEDVDERVGLRAGVSTIDVIRSPAS